MLRLEEIKRLASEAGFDLCGVAPCRPMPRNEAWLRAWLDRGYQSSLAYMERHAEKRFDPARLVEGAVTAVVCAVGYKNRFSGGYTADCRTKVASYACAADYHVTVRRQLDALFAALRRTEPGLAGRAFVDTAPLGEKQLAVEAGLGWIGRQSLLVTPQFGSYVVLGELLLTAPCDGYDRPIEGAGCGSCRRCIDSCPTAAIVADRTVDTNRCISCHTIEREPREGIDLHGWIFGCDGCQSCCPYNLRAPEHRNAAFDPLFDPAATDAACWRAMTPDAFDALLGTTPLTRSGLERIRRNVEKNRIAPDDQASR